MSLSTRFQREKLARHRAAGQVCLRQLSGKGFPSRGTWATGAGQISQMPVAVREEIGDLMVTDRTLQGGREEDFPPTEGARFTTLNNLTGK